ncbi:MAG: hypothetical protein IJM80_07295 [Firmicutes bacterium]|nr:hypothetical protein [Bacillota bacterium]
MKKTAQRFFIVILCCLFSFCIATAQGIENKTLLSEAPDKELETILSESNVDIYNVLGLSRQELLTSVRAFIKYVEDYGFCPRYAIEETDLFAQQVYTAIKNYYSKTGFPTKNDPNAYFLTDSELFSTPENVNNFRCYAYALNRTVNTYVGQFSGTALTQTQINSMTISQIADRVVQDLNSSTLKYDCAYTLSTIPSVASMKTGQTLICVRKGSGFFGADYHFMRRVGSNWLHKPGQSSILRYKYTPSNSLDWTNEGVVNGVPTAPNAIYSGNIIYIVFSKHHYGLAYTGYSYHSGNKHYYEYSGTCTSCGQYYSSYYVVKACSGPPCPSTDPVLRIDPTCAE